jgi:hypothetical protein
MGVRSRGGGREAMVARNKWAYHRCVPQRIGPVSLLGLSMVNLGSRASYRHGDRGPLPINLVVTPSIKALREV